MNGQETVGCIGNPPETRHAYRTLQIDYKALSDDDRFKTIRILITNKSFFEIDLHAKRYSLETAIFKLP
jgi:hypothetical protein